MLIFPTPRIGTCTIGCGATTAAEGPATPRRPDIASMAGGGATTETSGRPSRRDVVWLTAGGGAPAHVMLVGAVSGKRLVSEARIALGAGIDAAVSGEPGLVNLTPGEGG